MNISNCAYESHSPAHMNKENLEWNLLLLSLIVNKKKKKHRNFIGTAVTAASLNIICLDHTWDNILVHPAWSWPVLCEVLHKVYGMFEFYLFMNVIHFQPELAILTHEFHRSSHRKTDVKGAFLTSPLLFFFEICHLWQVIESKFWIQRKALFHLLECYLEPSCGFGK